MASTKSNIKKPMTVENKDGNTYTLPEIESSMIGSRKKVFINGFEYYVDQSVNPAMFYESETSTNGIPIDSAHWTKDEKRQICEVLKTKLEWQ
jgi:hypothetical protein